MLFGLLNFQRAQIDILQLTQQLHQCSRNSVHGFKDVGIFQPSRLRLEFGALSFYWELGLLHSEYICFKLKILPTRCQLGFAPTDLKEMQEFS